MTEILSDRYQAALSRAFQLHQGQYRKGSRIPYLAHLLSVSALVMENNGDEDQAIAALLHDAVEDQGGRPTLESIKRQFGERVADIVEGCTDAYAQPKPPWKGRKTTYLTKLMGADDSVLLVSLADKVHNARSILIDLKNNEDSVWDKFKGGKEGTLWYYQSLVEIFDKTSFTILKNELSLLVDEITKRA
jgi:(p)ppGpp synthase/HD superfamily hydrolase